MDRRRSSRGCEQSVIPFSIAVPSPSAAHSSSPRICDVRAAEPLEDAALYLALRQGERVRVLRRENRHGATTSPPLHALRRTDDGAIVSQPSWCIAQREDGAVGLVPGSLLLRVPGARFALRQEGDAATRHSDPSCGVASSSSMPPEADSYTGEAENGDDDDDGDDATDALQLQRRRQSSLQDRLEAFHRAAFDAPPTAVKPLSSTPHPSPPAPPCSAGAEQSLSESEREEHRKLAQQAAQVRAELRWLLSDVVPRLQDAHTRAEGTAMSDDHRSPAADTPPTATLRAAEAHTRELEGVAQLLHRAEALHAELGRLATTRTVSMPDSSPPPPLASSSSTDGAASMLNARDVNVASSSSTTTVTAAVSVKGTTATDSAAKAPSTAATDRHAMSTLRRLVKEERETVGLYQSQTETLRQRLTQLAALMSEAAVETASLSESETALHCLLGTSSDSMRAAEVDWPRTLPGLTAEEEEALSASLRVYDKYTRKLRLLADGGKCGHAVSSSVEHSVLTNTSINSSACAVTPIQSACVTDGTPSTNNGSDTTATPTPTRVEHLRHVKEKGDRELAQLQTKLEDVQRFCDTYGPIAHEIDEQMRRGERLLRERQLALKQLAASSPRGS
ncbi:hypothetical protein NESM_000701000 [Novymonas esmeraldas]|uniref:SH3 domain-containing protein n=1 Tax=Novymonas esmeraldas TaxID=1808958 RepID=A0AAW0EVG3_9TRYP